MPDDIHTQPLLLEIAIEPKSRADGEKLGIALAKLVSEDPSLGVSTDQVSGQTRAATVDYTYKKQTGRAGYFARIKIVAEPLPSSSGFVFEDKVVGGGVPKEFLPGVGKGLEQAVGIQPLMAAIRA